MPEVVMRACTSKPRATEVKETVRETSACGSRSRGSLGPKAFVASSPVTSSQLIFAEA
jgi:hypothetical protein